MAKNRTIAAPQSYPVVGRGIGKQRENLKAVSGCLRHDSAAARLRSGARRWGHGTSMALERRQSILVWDESGRVFGALRRSAVPASLWRVSGKPQNGDLEQVDLAVVALYRSSDWKKFAALVRRTRTVIVSTTSDRRDAARALASGAFGYVDLGVSSRAMRRALVSALRGEPAYSRAVLGDRIRARLGTATSGGARRLELTPRQREVVALIATGASDKEIGTALGIATATAQKHVTRLLKRLDVPNRAAAVAATVISP